MKAHDRFFITAMVAVMIHAVMTAYFVYPSSPAASLFALGLGAALTVGVRADWKKYKGRNNL